ncbi:Peptide deformylase 4 [Carbonactinospora thermoautotrophica]|uniref:Peptide deformylase n=1 Tax=Carbonactinospora thermoautotrophica TaxID=1469144 RepID=A0A132MMB2_9ACTN|nr:peptide deformylase [Carbonactinospora thermoautotrophica]KWW98997.1 Peptide deformylase 4 [Carbonactinospora thermoautotrophica]
MSERTVKQSGERGEQETRPQAGPGRRGTVRPIVQLGDPVLRKPCAEVTDFGPELEQLAEDMFASMYAANGCGLAANQIGVSLRVFVYDCPTEEGDHVGVVVNPRLELPDVADRVLLEEEEGCLSIKGGWARVARPSYAVVHGFDLRGEPITVEGTGYFARCLQHECDHLDGGLYIDRLPARARKSLLRSLNLQEG